MIKTLAKISPIALLWAWVCMEIIKPGWTINVLLGLDILANTIIWGDVETISARSGKEIMEADPNPLARKLCWVLDLFDPDHCQKAAE